MNNIKDIHITIPEYALAVMRPLWDAGEEVYIVGGCVRDALLGKEPHDYDMAVSCQPEDTLRILSGFRTIPTGLKHGTVTAISEGQPIELTTFRVDGSYTDSRRPDSVSFTRSVEDDLSRRDFTVNAMAYSPRTGLIDLFGGRDDLENRIIRAVGEAEKRFSEDALRIMRAFRFSAQLGFSVDLDTQRGAYSCRGGLKNIARERIGAEFIRLLCSPQPYAALRLMKELDILGCPSPDYTPSDKIFSLLESMPPCDTARLGFFLCEAESEKARGVLSSLKCSNRQKSGALAVAREARTVIKTSVDAALLRSRIGELSLFAARASMLLGVSGESAVTLVESNRAPVTLGELVIDGKELASLGIKGREIGKTLHCLLDAVMENPALNTKESLLSLAKKHIEGE